MRAVKPLSLLATRIRSQEWMDQQYIVNVAKNLIGELKITDDVLEKHPLARDFSLHVFQAVLHHVSSWSSETLGKIMAYGLGRGQTSGGIPLRFTTLEEVMVCEQDTALSGAVALERYATATLVAAIHDILVVKHFANHLKREAAKGARDGVRLGEACASFALRRRR